MSVVVARRPFTVEEFQRMRTAGILKEDDRVELIDGEVRKMSPAGPLHAAIVRRLNLLLHRLLAGSYVISVQDPMRLSDYSEPQQIEQYADPIHGQYATKRAWGRGQNISSLSIPSLTLAVNDVLG
jgi:Putative restriction endonuclease